MSRREVNKLRGVRRGYRHHLKKKNGTAKLIKETHERESFLLWAQSERSVKGSMWLCMKDAEWGVSDDVIPDGGTLRKVWFSFHRWGIWDLERSRFVSVSHLVSGEAKIQTQISVMINSSGACWLQKIGNHLGPSGFWWVTDSEQDGDGWSWMWSPQWAEGRGLISYFSSPSPSPQFQTRDLSYQVRQSWRELLGT